MPRDGREGVAARPHVQDIEGDRLVDWGRDWVPKTGIEVKGRQGSVLLRSCRRGRRTRTPGASRCRRLLRCTTASRPRPVPIHPPTEPLAPSALAGSTRSGLTGTKATSRARCSLRLGAPPPSPPARPVTVRVPVSVKTRPPPTSNVLAPFGVAAVAAPTLFDARRHRQPATVQVLWSL